MRNEVGAQVAVFEAKPARKLRDAPIEVGVVDIQTTDADSGVELGRGRSKTANVLIDDVAEVDSTQRSGTTE